jgi:hypothetical protein
MRRQRICRAGQPPTPLSKQFKVEAGIVGPASASVAVAAAGIGKSLPGNWNELPVIAFGFQSKLEYSEGVCVANLAVCLDLGKWALTLSAISGNEFADAAGRVGVAARSLWSETLAVVIVAIDDHIRVGFIQSLSQRLNL